jgi:hypothetical protein
MDEENKQTAESAPAGEIGPMTESAAADLLSEWKEIESAPRVDTARAQANEAEAAAAEKEEAAAEPSQEEPTAEATPEAEVEEAEEYAHGNTKTRLRDGSEITVGELKKLADEAKEYKRREADFARIQQQVQARAMQTAQQERLFSQAITQAIQAVQATLPPEPDPRLRQTDPIDYFLRKDARQQKLMEIQNLQQAQQYSAQQASAQRAQDYQERLKAEQSLLYERAPELSDEGKRREFYNDLVSAGKSYGFSEDEINDVQDHRVMLMIQDALRYRKLQAAKPKVMEKTKDAKKPPVAQPAPRQSSNERIATKHAKLFERAKRTRSVDDVGALLAELD